MVPRGQRVEVAALASSRLCFSALLMLSDGVMSPTMHSAMSWTRASFIHLRTRDLFLTMTVRKPSDAGRSEVGMCQRSTCPCSLSDRWWSETSLPCGTCDLTHSQDPSHSCKPSQSWGPSIDNIKHNKKTRKAHSKFIFNREYWFAE